MAQPLPRELGEVLTVAPGVPLLGAHWSQSIPNGETWKVFAITQIFTVAAGAPDFNVSIMDIIGNPIAGSSNPFAFGAGTNQISFGIGMDQAAAVVGPVILYYSWPLADNWIKGPAVLASVGNIGAGDQLSGIRITYARWRSL